MKIVTHFKAKVAVLISGIVAIVVLLAVLGTHFLAPQLKPVVAATVKVIPNCLFSDGAVLQEGQPIPIFGTAANAAPITVQFAGQTAHAVAKHGRWIVHLRPVRSGGPYRLTIAGPSNTVVINDVLVGEVFLCSGQSNMGFDLLDASDATQAMASSNDSHLRLYYVPAKLSFTPVYNTHSRWVRSTPNTSPYFPAVPYFFGCALRKSLKVPIGLIDSVRDGSVAQSWLSAEALSKLPFGNKAAKDVSSNKNGILYNGMITPLIPYGIKGVIWYQGESNTDDPSLYKSLLPALIADWRNKWGMGQFPFYFVQLAPYLSVTSAPQESGWASIRETQRLTAQRVPNTGMAVITDAGDSGGIHPRRKHIVGTRLARIALARTYHRAIEYTGPVVKNCELSGRYVIIHFTHARGLHTQKVVDQDGSVVSPASKVMGFTAIAAGSAHYFNVLAQIVNGTVRLLVPARERIVEIRYGWADYPQVNLYNSAGLPASPFESKVTSQ